MNKISKHHLSISNFVIMSLISEADQGLFMRHADPDERTSAVLKWLANELEVRNVSEWGSLDNGEKIFETRPKDFDNVKRSVQILLKEYRNNLG